jgi:4-hydroxy-tetrahydrodipicolinate synthase
LRARPDFKQTEEFMHKNPSLSGVYAAALTPLHADQSLALEDIPGYLNFLANRGCHGALILGTTGEGPSFEAKERILIFKAAIEFRQFHPDFRLLAGTGTPSLEETIFLTKTAYNLGFNGVVVLPPYYFHQATDDGLFEWFQNLINRAVPRDGQFLGYHFPAQSRVPLSLNLLLQLRDSFPDQFVGIKDSSKDSEYAHHAYEIFDANFKILTGSDRFLSSALEAGASGCITAMANLFSPKLREVWDAHQQGKKADAAQKYLSEKRTILEQYPPFAPTIKAMLPMLHGLPSWSVRPPLVPLDEVRAQLAANELRDVTPK